MPKTFDISDLGHANLCHHFLNAKSPPRQEMMFVGGPEVFLGMYWRVPREELIQIGHYFIKIDKFCEGGCDLCFLIITIRPTTCNQVSFWVCWGTAV